jgi:hypothetical protein
MGRRVRRRDEAGAEKRNWGEWMEEVRKENEGENYGLNVEGVCQEREPRFPERGFAMSNVMKIIFTSWRFSMRTKCMTRTTTFW